jgi:glutaredoxin
MIPEAEKSPHRILYVGADITLAARLTDALQGCRVVRSPVDSARTLIRSGIKYSLLLFDDDSRGAELEAYARTLEHREHTPVVMFKESEGFGKLVSQIERRLAGL